MAQALYAKNGALCVQGGALIVGSATAEPACVCAGGPTEECIQPGPCCEPEWNGRCTPRGYTRNPDGSWTGLPPLTIAGRVSCIGSVTIARTVQSFLNPIGATKNYTMPLDFPQSDPRSTVTLQGFGTGDCRRYSGSGAFFVPPAENPSLPSVERCGGPILPVFQYERFLQSDLLFSPAANIPGAFNGDGLAEYRVRVRAWEFEAEITVVVSRRYRSSGLPAVAVARAEIAANASTGLPRFFPANIPVAISQSPCGTVVEVSMVKGPLESPFPTQGPDYCPPPLGVINPDFCRVCNGLAYDFKVVINLGDGFEACKKCDEAPLPIPCPCQSPQTMRALGAGAWEPLRIQFLDNSQINYTASQISGNPNYPTATTFRGEAGVGTDCLGPSPCEAVQFAELYGSATNNYRFTTENGAGGGQYVRVSAGASTNPRIDLGGTSFDLITALGFPGTTSPPCLGMVGGVGSVPLPTGWTISGGGSTRRIKYQSTQQINAFFFDNQDKASDINNYGPGTAVINGTASIDREWVVSGFVPCVTQSGGGGESTNLSRPSSGCASCGDNNTGSALL